MIFVEMSLTSAVKMCLPQQYALLLYGGKVPDIEKPTVFLWKQERVVILCEWTNDRLTIIRESDWEKNRYIVRDANAVFNGAGEMIWAISVKFAELERIE